jgi:peptidoglycan/LPS O-acetylase OafA/YrhL
MNTLHAWMRSYTLGDVAHGRRNNLNLLRFLAAALVIVSHSYALGWDRLPEPILKYWGHLETGGTLGVLVFFSISGYLITQSFAARHHLESFLLARALRIYPGLIAATFFSALIASFATSVPFAKFAADPMTRTFLLHNSLGFPTEFYLPGAFAANPFPGAVNGALWTLPIEMEMYILVALLGLIGYFANRTMFNAFFVAFLAYALVFRPSEWLPIFSESGDAVRMAMIFLLGMFCFMNRDRVPLSIPAAALVVVLIAIFHKVPDIRTYYLPAVAYVVLVLAYHPKLYFAAFTRLGDYSYGLYIYAFPLQQWIAFRAKGIGAVSLFWLAFPCALAMAILSWTFLEKPMLGLKPRIAPTADDVPQKQSAAILAEGAA